jgi:single-stranded-DNA-specific exonuclease
MTRITTRPVPGKRQWQLEQQGLHPLLARLYAARGIESRHELDYELKSLLPPGGLKGMAAAAELLADAIEAEARIVIIGDYDCDGATATAVGMRALRAFGANVDFLVPNRFTYGYGLSPQIVDLAAAAEQPPELIVTVDNGIASLDGVARARELGIATLITDHHLPGEALPEADAIVNPNQPGCDFASKSLAGVGVMFYVMLALRSVLDERGWFASAEEGGSGRAKPNLGLLLDLVALGTVADVVGLDRNNRILVAQGLKRIREGKTQPGIRALFRAAGRDWSRATSFDLGFMVGPRINAAGRLSDMSIGIRCLLADDDAAAMNLAQQLDSLNRERRTIEAEMQEQAQAILDLAERTELADAVAISLFDESWHQGVVGIVASRIKDRMHRPVFAFARADDGDRSETRAGSAETGRNEGLLRGSGRSIPGLHLRDALDLVSKRAPGLLQKFGGHAAAAGVTIAEADLPSFREVFVQVVGELLSPAALTRTLETDGGLESGYFSLEIARLLQDEVWGQGFPAPLFADVFVVEQQRLLKETHLKLRLRKGNMLIEAIQFNCANPAPAEAQITYRLQINEYNGVASPQLIVEHIGAAPKATAG